MSTEPGLTDSPEYETVFEYVHAVSATSMGRLAAGARMATATEEFLRREIHDARLRGYTWRQIATALGVSRQAANQRFGSKK